MAKPRKTGLVYSTEAGRICPRCGWPAGDCGCDTAQDEAVPAKITARLRIEKAGRSGKTVTVVDGLPRNRPFLSGLAKELKRSCGSGGSAGDGRVEIQGDQRQRVRPVLLAKGWTVKG